MRRQMSTEHALGNLRVPEQIFEPKDANIEFVAFCTGFLRGKLVSVDV